MVRLHSSLLAISVAIPLSLAVHAAAFADDYAENLRLLASNNDGEAEVAAEWFAKYPFDAQKQAEVSRALNALDRDSVRASARAALAVWGTKENVPLIAKLLGDRVDRDVALELAGKLPDPRLVEPLIAVLSSPFDDGKRAEQLLANWSSDADEALIKRLNDPHDETHNRIARIIAERKIDPKLLARQSLADLSAADAQQRRYAVEWLATAEDVPAELHSPLTAEMLKLLKDAKLGVRIEAGKILQRCAHKDHDAELLKLLEDKEPAIWQAGLMGLIRTGNVAGAKKLAERMQSAPFLGQAARTMTGAGPAAENLAIAILREPLQGGGETHLMMTVVLGDIGTTKSVSALQQFAKKNSRGPKGKLMVNAAESAAKQIASRKTAGSKQKAR